MDRVGRLREFSFVVIPTATSVLSEVDFGNFPHVSG